MAITTSAVIALAATAASAGVAVYGQQQQKKTALRLAEYNAKQQENEAIRIDQESREAIRRKRIDNQRKLGWQRARIAASGVLEAGSPLEVMGETAALLELEALEIGRQAEAGIRQTTSQAEIYRQGGINQARAFAIASAGTLLNAGTSLASTSLNFRQTGVI